MKIDREIELIVSKLRLRISRSALTSAVRMPVALIPLMTLSSGCSRDVCESGGKPSVACEFPAIEADGSTKLPNCPTQAEGSSFGEGIGFACSYLVCIDAMVDGRCAPCSNIEGWDGWEDRMSLDPWGEGGEQSEYVDQGDGSESGSDGISIESVRTLCDQLGERFESLDPAVGIQGPYGVAEYTCLPEAPVSGKCCYGAYFAETWACGRPFRVREQTLTCDFEAQSWPSDPPEQTKLEFELQREFQTLSDVDRDRMAVQWRRLAGLEYASVASFARFALQLMHMGAPPQLVLAAQQAGLDEYRHAELCLKVVRALTGVRLRPQPMKMPNLEIGELGSIIEDLIVEGCIGESIAAGTLRLEASHCAGPSLAALLSEIAGDEFNHTALSWSALSWMAVQTPREVVEVIDRLSVAGWASSMPQPQAIAEHEHPQGAGESAASEGLSRRTRRRLHDKLWVDVIDPALRGIRQQALQGLA